MVGVGLVKELIRGCYVEGGDSVIVIVGDFKGEGLVIEVRVVLLILFLVF